MKKILFMLTILIVLLSCNSRENQPSLKNVTFAAEDNKELPVFEHNIWGVWNGHPRGSQTSAIFSSMGRFMSTSYFLLFDPNYRNTGIPQIVYDASDTIKKIIPYSENTVLVILEYELIIFDVNDNISRGPDYFTGTVAMHFIDEDHMWLEVVWDNPKYPTDPEFPTGYFEGPSRIFWRAEKVED